jgi:hypothetical protein
VNKPHQIDLPGGHKDFSGSAIHLEAWQMGECSIRIAREDFSDAREVERDFRWHMMIGHPSRKPTLEEVSEARKLLPEDVFLVVPFPHRAYWLEIPSHAVDLIEVQDSNLTAQLEYDGIKRRGEGAAEVWVDGDGEGR